MSADGGRWAVGLHESTPGATLKRLAADLRISGGSLREWDDTFGSGATTVPARSTPSTGRSKSQSAKIVRQEAELAASLAEQIKLEMGRDVLRHAAKCFAGVTNC